MYRSNGLLSLAVLLACAGPLLDGGEANFSQMSLFPTVVASDFILFDLAVAEPMSGLSAARATTFQLGKRRMWFALVAPPALISRIGTRHGRDGLFVCQG